MAALTRRRLFARVRAALDTLVTGHAHVVFSRRRVVGLLIMAALATEPRCLGVGLCALVVAELTTRVLGLRDPYAPYAYNALLCGVAVARECALTPTAIGLAVALGGGSVIVTAGLVALTKASSAGYIPVYSMPFVLCSWFAVGAMPHLPLSGAQPVPDGLASALPSLPALALQSFGGVVLLPRASAGVFVLAGLLVHSRIASVLGLISVLSVLALLGLTHAPLADTVAQTAACCAGLAAMSIGGIWLIPSGASSLLALGTALLATFFTLGLWTPFLRLGLPLSFVPFNATLILVLSALRQRGPNRAPALAQVAAETPEELRANYDPEPPETDGALRQHLPFAAAWICTQGVDGPYTHRGSLRYGYDFEMLGGADGALCGGTGEYARDYHCFGQPVLAAADGTVAAIENTVPNNAVGDDNAQKPWGNYVVLYHASGVYSLVAHLSVGSVVVYPGQLVARGTVLGYCGNSGRAPRPHLHFQLQTTATPGSPTLPSGFTDVIVETGNEMRFEALHRPRTGQVLQTLAPEYAISALFEVPLGATLTYQIDGKPERIVSDLDGWGRSVLRSLDRGTELVLTRSESRFSCGELRGDSSSTLSLLRVVLPEVPLERRSKLTFRSKVCQRDWLGGPLGKLRWELAAPFGGARRIEMESRFETDANGIAIIGASIERAPDGKPLIQTRALMGGAMGPRLLEVLTGGRARRAELVVEPESPDRLVQQYDVSSVAAMASQRLQRAPGHQMAQ